MKSLRAPLREADANQHSPVKGAMAKHTSIAGAKISKTKKQPQLSTAELARWQENWRSIMRNDTRIYFDTKDSLVSLAAKQKQDKLQDRLKQAFLSLGAIVEPFFGTSITIVVTKRTVKNFDDLPPNDLLQNAKKQDMKVWTYDKAVRFLKNLDIDVYDDGVSLSTLLNNEKLYGPNDRDPRTKRDDIHYLKHPFVYVYDLRQITRPIVAKEWRAGCKYPRIYHSSMGRCPFMEDPCDEENSRRVAKRQARDALNEAFATSLKQLYYATAVPRAYDGEMVQLEHGFPTVEDIEQETPMKRELHLMLMRNPSDFATQSTTQHPPLKKQRINYEIKASGVNASNAQSQQMEGLRGNGLAPEKSTVPNKEFRALNDKKVFQEKFEVPKKPATVAPKRKEYVGYCENCRVRYEDFEEHVAGEKHRAYAEDPLNFEGIDMIIRDLEGNRRL